jgi:hypothetical protein
MELSMESYIDKLGTDFKRANAPRRYHPLAVKALKLQLRAKDDLAPPQLTQRYQSIIGKLLYPASQLRADIAFAVGYLARAMSNPTELHFEYALQVLDYLYTTKITRYPNEMPINPPSNTPLYWQSPSLVT